jgi:hypothetical protein
MHAHLQQHLQLHALGVRLQDAAELDGEELDAASPEGRERVAERNCKYANIT